MPHPRPLDLAAPRQSEKDPIGVRRIHRRHGKRIILIASVLVVLVAGAGIGMYVYSTSDPIPKSVSSQVNFPLFYPTALPQQWTLDKSSFDADPNAKIVSYVLNGPSGNLNITIQSAPKSFDFNNFYTKRLSGTLQFLTPLGQGAVGKAIGTNQLVGSLVTSSSWVLASPSSSGVTQANIQFVLTHLQTVSP